MAKRTDSKIFFSNKQQQEINSNSKKGNLLCYEIIEQEHKQTYKVACANSLISLNSLIV